MQARDLAFVVHRTPTRIRIKIPGRRRQKCYFEALKPALLAHPDILEVETSPLTGSVIINCRAGFTLATKDDQQFALLELAPADILAPIEAGRVHPHVGIEGCPSSTMAILAGVLEAFLAITTNQLGARIAEWLVQALVEAARGEAHRQALRGREALLLGITK
jgi:hypothetical protein